MEAEGGAQGAGMTGTQGWGVSTPWAAAVAAATCGLDGLMHIPNVAMLAPGAMSVIVAMGRPSAKAHTRPVSTGTRRSPALATIAR